MAEDDLSRVSGHESMEAAYGMLAAKILVVDLGTDKE